LGIEELETQIFIVNEFVIPVLFNLYFSGTGPRHRWSGNFRAHSAFFLTLISIFFGAERDCG